MANPKHLELARQGRDAWNERRRGNHDEPADFSGADFNTPENLMICFAGFEFGDYADFSDTNFGDLPPDILRWMDNEFLLSLRPEGILRIAEEGRLLGAGSAIFAGASFGDQTIFANATFGNQTIFAGATFGNEAVFVGARFGNEATFDEATFGFEADFGGATFGDEAFFVRARFGNGVFVGTTFGNKATFAEATFGNMADFAGATFGNGADFADARFNDANFRAQSKEELLELWRRLYASHDAWVVWQKTAITEPIFERLEGAWEKTIRDPSGFASVSFRGAEFRGDVNFVGRKFNKEADFAHARFVQPPDFLDTHGHDSLNWSGIRFGFRGQLCPFELIQTWIRKWTGGRKVPEPATTTEPDNSALLLWLRNIKILTWLRNIEIPMPGWTTEPDIAARLRRLRKIATEILAADTERDLLILERKAERGILWKRDWSRALLPTVLMLPYQLFSNCGRSMLLPLFWLSASNAGFYGWYKSLIAPEPQTERVTDALLTFTLANALPFGGASQQSFQQVIDKLIADRHVQPLVQMLSTVQGIVNAMLIFLLLLAMRNYFRFK